AVERLTERVGHLGVEHLVPLEVLDLEVLEPAPHLFEPVELALRAIAQLLHFALAALADLAAHIALGALGLELGQVGLELLLPGLDVDISALLDALLLDLDLGLERGQVPVARLLEAQIQDRKSTRLNSSH